MGWSLDTTAEVLSAIDLVEASANADDLLKALRHFMDRKGFDHVAIGPLINPATLNAPISNFGVTDFPEEYREIWVERNYMMQDPILRYGLASRNAFTWEEAYKRADKTGQRVLDHGRDFALTKGIAVPVPVPGMPTGLITLSHTDPDFSRADRGAIEIVAIHAYTKLLDIVALLPEPRPYSLTARETEVMHYVAAGKTNWEIGEILGVSENAIKAHLKNILRKTDAVNRAHSVTKTIKDGAIIP